MIVPAGARSASRIRRVGNRQILMGVLAEVVRRSLADPRRRRMLFKNMWIEVRRFAGPHVLNIEITRLRGVQGVRVEGPVARLCPLVLTAISTLLECERIFEIGTYRGDTSWLLAHNLPTTRVYTLDLPGLNAVGHTKFELTDPEYFVSWDRGTRFHGTPEADRITELHGDSGTFDFSPYRGSMDLVFVDGSHSYDYVKSDTEAAIDLLSPLGTIVWDDYTYYPGIYTYLNELAPSLDRPIFHILGTRLAMYSKWDIVLPED